MFGRQDFSSALETDDNLWSISSNRQKFVLPDPCTVSQTQSALNN